MKKLDKCLLSAAVVFVCSACSKAPVPTNENNSLVERTLEEAKTPDANGFYNFLRADLRNLNVEELHSDWRDHMMFDSLTKWPENFQQFDPEEVLEINKTPGYHIEQVHEAGITGKNINIAVIGPSILENHEEYKESLTYIPLQNPQKPSTVVGTQIASLLVGKTTGLAPDAHLYYFEHQFGKSENKNGKLYTDAGNLVESMERVLSYNKDLQPENQIDILYLAEGYILEDRELAVKSASADELNALLTKAEEAGIKIVAPSVDSIGTLLYRLDKKLDASIDDTSAYSLNSKVTNQDSFYFYLTGTTYASYTGDKDYVYANHQSSELNAAYLAGLYALSAQSNENLNEEQFLKNLANSKVDIGITDANDIIVLVIDPLKLLNI